MILSSTSALAFTPKRIVSLVPSQTELLHYLGLEQETIGITKFCIHPDQWFRTKTRIGGTKKLDIQKIFDLQPDLIIANKEENVAEQVKELAEKIPVWLTDVNNLEDALQMITDIGQLTGKAPEAEKLAKAIEQNFLEIRNLPAENEKIKTAYLIWRDPYMTVGVDTYISSILQFAGLTNAFSNRTRYPEISVAEIASTGCKLLLLSSEPYPFNETHIQELQEQLPGVKILLVNGEIFSWYGSRLLEVPRYLKEMSAIIKKK